MVEAHRGRVKSRLGRDTGTEANSEGKAKGLVLRSDTALIPHGVQSDPIPVKSMYRVGQGCYFLEVLCIIDSRYCTSYDVLDTTER
jgi:hypothetical protein